MPNSIIIKKLLTLSMFLSVTALLQMLLMLGYCMFNNESTNFDMYLLFLCVVWLLTCVYFRYRVSKYRVKN